MIMKQSIRPFVILLACSGVLLLTACSSSGSSTSTVHYGVYTGYGYPYYRYDVDNNYYYNRPDRPDRPNRPIRPERPVTLPVQRPGGGMGRPAGISRGGGGGFGGGGRGGGRR